MRSVSNEIYDLVDENFLTGFTKTQSALMKKHYYTIYKSYCVAKKLKALEEDLFFTNMRRRKIKLLQVCCPYCGHVTLIVSTSNIDNLESMNYCTQCGKRSASDMAFLQISRVLRTLHFHSKCLKAFEEDTEEENTKILTYDVYQLELITITSVLEVILRDLYVSMVFLSWPNSKNNYINGLINKSIGNDFMNIEKANNHYKKALNINLKTMISHSCWNDLVDVVNIRNTVVHNNGFIDDQFRRCITYNRITELIDGNLIFLSQKIISKYLKQLVALVNAITKSYEEIYLKNKYTLIANFYFNESTLDFLEFSLRNPRTPQENK